jgi:hypothetical protein
MAAALGDRVRVKLSSAVPALSPNVLQPQPPTIGIVTLLGSPLQVAFAGKSLAAVPEADLDVLKVTSALLRDEVIDKVVTGIRVPATATTPAIPYSSEYTGRVVDIYDVDSVNNTQVLIRTLSNGAYYELPFLKVLPLENR